MAESWGRCPRGLGLAVAGWAGGCYFPGPGMVVRLKAKIVEDLADGQYFGPSLPSLSCLEGDGLLVWGAGSWNRSHGLQPDGAAITLRIPLKRASRGGRPRAGCRAWARSALVEASDQVLMPPKGFGSRGNRLSLKALGNLEP